MADERKRSAERDEQASGFKVSDRRKFTADGERRGETPVDRPGPPPDDQPPAGRPEPSAPPPAAAATGPAPGRGAVAPDLHFQALVQSLLLDALIGLGEAENPITHQLEPNIDMARHAIDTLAMLLEKTRGNLSAEESAMLEHLVPQLQMHFVQKAR